MITVIPEDSKAAILLQQHIASAEISSQAPAVSVNSTSDITLAPDRSILAPRQQSFSSPQ